MFLIEAVGHHGDVRRKSTLRRLLWRLQSLAAVASPFAYSSIASLFDASCWRVGVVVRQDCGISYDMNGLSQDAERHSSLFFL